jgi:predicted enzyme related to lactoylglutathione lyase
MNTTTTKLPAHFKGNYGTMYYVKNMKKSVAFYRDVIGLTPQFEEDGWSQFDLGGSALCLHPAGDNVTIKPVADKSTATNGVLIIEVTDIRKVVNSLKEKRVEFIGDVTDMGECGMCADFKDLDGNIIGLFQQPAGHAK